MSAPNFILPNDLIPVILQHLSNEPHTLFRCSLVNRDWSVAAASVLYETLELHASETPGVINLRDRGELLDHACFQSASLPHNAKYVRDFVMTGEFSATAPPKNVLGQTLTRSICQFHNLRRLCLTPSICHDDLFTDVIPTIPANCPSLEELIVNDYCTDAQRAPLLVEISNLRAVTIYSPSRAFLNLLPDWLDRLSSTLRELHLKNNCGSVTPGVLKSFAPFVKDHLRSFTLGLSYSLMDDDVFPFLNQLVELTNLDVQYVPQHREPSISPHLPNLRSITVHHSSLSEQHSREVNRLAKWIRWLVSKGPLEHIRLLDQEISDSATAGANFDGLVDHLAAKHGTTLRTIDLSGHFVGHKTLQSLLARCTGLEELALACSRAGLETFESHSSGLTQLTSLAIDIRNVKRNFVFTDDMAEHLIRVSPPSLRKVRINDATWEARWVVDEVAESKPRLMVVKDTND